METDIVFDSAMQCFWVYHPPLEDKQKLTFENFIKKTASNISVNYWFDTRYVDSNNCVMALAELNRLNQLYHFKSKAIFELYDLHAANYVASAGYQVSLNISPNSFSNKDQLQQLSSGLSEKVKFVSQESDYVQQLKQSFTSKQIITWSISFSNYFNRTALKKLAADPRVECVLVNVKSRHYK